MPFPLLVFFYHATSDAENCLSVIFSEGAGYLTTAEKQAMDEMREKECKLLQLYKVPIFVLYSETVTINFKVLYFLSGCWLQPSDRWKCNLHN